MPPPWTHVIMLYFATVGFGCASDHRVSPWPQGVTLDMMMQPADLEANAARVDRELAAEGLVLEVEVDGTFEDGEPFRILAYRGSDDFGNPKTALRVATRYGVVMALGPTSPDEALRGDRVSFLPAIGEERSWASGSDVNGDGMPDVMVTKTGGGVEIWGLHARGASPYPIDASVPLTGAMDIDGDGRPDLMGRVPVPPGDTLSPRLVEVVTFSQGRYRPDTPSVRAFHRRQLDAMTGSEVRAPRALVERAWHTLRGGREPQEALEALDEALQQSPLTAEQHASLSRWRSWLNMAERQHSEPGSGGVPHGGSEPGSLL